MKNCTDLEQSKKLVEFLPLESADMGWNVFVDDTTRILPIDDWDLVKDGSGNVKFYHAWSLAALLNILRAVSENSVELYYTVGNRWAMECYALNQKCIEDEPVDACVAMIEKLNKEELL